MDLATWILNGRDAESPGARLDLTDDQVIGTQTL